MAGYRGKFHPRNPCKYRGDWTKIVYRSLWERRVMVHLDGNDSVLEWASEEVIIPYKSPKDQKVHRYFVDFYVKALAADGETTRVQLWEVKPAAQTKEPIKRTTPTGRTSRRFLREVVTFGVNKAKWLAADEYCKDRGWEFKILTEYDLGLKKRRGGAAKVPTKA